MIATWLLGLSLIWLMGRPHLLQPAGCMLKLVLVLAMTALHGFCARWRTICRRPEPAHAKFYRIINEIPTVLMIVIVILAVVKPF